MMRRRTQLLGAAVAGAALSLVGSGIAFADYVTNNVTSTAAGKVLEITAGGTATVVYGIQNQNNNAGDTQNNCNPADGSGVRIVATGAPTGVTSSQPVATDCSAAAASMVFSVGSAVAAGSYTIAHSFTDAGGGVYVDNASFTLKVNAAAPSDSTPPTITPTVTGTLGDNGWHTSNVAVSWVVSDPQSAVSSSSGCGSTTITADQDATIYTCTATSAGGTSTESVTVKRDATAPSVRAGTPTGTPGQHDWYTSDVTVPFTASDSGSGLADSAQASFSVTSTTTGSAVSIASGTVKDQAGNTASAAVTVAIDAANPMISAELDKAAAPSGWFNTTTGAPTVSYTCTVGGSPIGDCPADYTFVEGENQSHSGTVIAASGRDATAGVTDVDVDLTAPSISGTDTNDTTWRNSDRTEAFTASDATSGLATASDAEFLLTASAESASAAAPTTVSRTVRDTAGNSTTRTLSALIDRTAPTVSAPQTNTTWSNGASVTSDAFTAWDGLSGIPTADESFTLSATAESTKVNGAVVPTTVTRSITDAAGNTSQAEFSALIDRTAPSVSLVGGPADGSTVWSTQTAPTCNASDDLSGLAGACTVTGFSRTVGQHTVTATATDNAGNTSTATRTYSVRDLTTTGFYQPVDMNGVYNVVKGGSTVPLKFNVQVNGVNQTDLALITKFTATITSCSSSAPVDDVEIVSTGGTTLRYDTTGAQFIQNWKTPTGAGTCYRATATLADGDTITALFKLK
jgi:hypothetical protein